MFDVVAGGEQRSFLRAVRAELCQADVRDETVADALPVLGAHGPALAGVRVLRLTGAAPAEAAVFSSVALPEIAEVAHACALGVHTVFREAALEL